ncbi:uncharacterized protein [Neodiprion pinetum]|uniref:uncharacterized protein n=1 Tax=Neodiprion pinetum TaxID=441929 RepID=UPI00371E0CC7
MVGTNSRGSDSGANSNLQPSLADIMKAIQANTAALHEYKHSQNRQTAEIIKSLEACHETAQANSNKIAGLEARLAEYDAQGESTRGSLSQLKLQMDALEVENNRLHQKLALNSVEIRGIPVKSNENLYSILNSIGNVLGSTLDAADVSSIYRLPSKDPTRPSPITAVLTRRDTAVNLVTCIRKRRGKLTTRDLQWKDNEVHDIFVSESLTPLSRKLFAAARAARQAKTVMYAWTKNGNVYVRERDGAPLIHVVKITDIPTISS